MPKGTKGFQRNHPVPNEIREKIQNHHNSKSNLNLVRGFWKGKKRGYNWANGRNFTNKHREKIRIGNLGKHSREKNPFWKGGITSLRALIYASSEYRKWRKLVFERDNFTCQECSRVGEKLNADHIKPFSLFPELRFVVSNGRTLCIDCHKKTPTYGNFLFTNKNYMEMLK